MCFTKASKAVHDLTSHCHSDLISYLLTHSSLPKLLLDMLSYSLIYLFAIHSPKCLQSFLPYLLQVPIAIPPYQNSFPCLSTIEKKTYAPLPPSFFYMPPLLRPYISSLHHLEFCNVLQISTCLLYTQSCPHHHCYTLRSMKHKELDFSVHCSVKLRSTSNTFREIVVRTFTA